MDDNNKIPNQNTPPVTPSDQAQSVVQPVASPTGDGIVSSVGSANKEIGPLGESAPQLSEISPAGAEREHNLSQELKDIGVVETKDRPDLTEEHRQAGIEHAGPAVPVPTTAPNSVQYPLSEEEVAVRLKTGRGDDSGKWLARLIKKVIAVMGFGAS